MNNSSPYVGWVRIRTFECSESLSEPGAGEGDTVGPPVEEPPPTVTCPICDGDGSCDPCYGSGHLPVGSTCPWCGGTGACWRCGGSGSIPALTAGPVGMLALLAFRGGLEADSLAPAQVTAGARALPPELEGMSESATFHPPAAQVCDSRALAG